MLLHLPIALPKFDVSKQPRFKSDSPEAFDRYPRDEKTNSSGALVGKSARAAPPEMGVLGKHD